LLQAKLLCSIAVSGDCDDMVLEGIHLTSNMFICDPSIFILLQLVADDSEVQLHLNKVLGNLNEQANRYLREI
jgi:hypothetical protein